MLELELPGVGSGLFMSDGDADEEPFGCVLPRAAMDFDFLGWARTSGSAEEGGVAT